MVLNFFCTGWNKKIQTYFVPGFRFLKKLQHTIQTWQEESVICHTLIKMVMKTLKARKGPFKQVKNNNVDFLKISTKGKIHKEARINYYTTHKNKQGFKDFLKSRFIPKVIIIRALWGGRKSYSNFQWISLTPVTTWMSSHYNSANRKASCFLNITPAVVCPWESFSSLVNTSHIHQKFPLSLALYNTKVPPLSPGSLQLSRESFTFCPFPTLLDHIFSSYSGHLLSRKVKLLLGKQSASLAISSFCEPAFSHRLWRHTLCKSQCKLW